MAYVLLAPLRGACRSCPPSLLSSTGRKSLLSSTGPAKRPPSGPTCELSPCVHARRRFAVHGETWIHVLCAPLSSRPPRPPSAPWQTTQPSQRRCPQKSALLGNHSMRGQVPAQGVALSGGGVKLPAWLASSLVPHPKPQDTHSHQPAPNTPAATQQAPSGKRENQVQGRSTGGTVSSTRLVLHVGRVTARFHARLLSVSCGVLCTACMLALAATHQLTLRHMAVPQAQTSTRCSWALAFLSTARTPRRLQASMQCRGALRSK